MRRASGLAGAAVTAGPITRDRQGNGERGMKEKDSSLNLTYAFSGF